MTEELISFDTAKLAKEKGFKGDVTHFYELDTIGTNQLLKLPIIPHDHQQEVFQAPTQSLLQKWLRKVHGVILQICFSRTFGYYYKIDRYGVVEKKYFDTYEEALEEGLQEALTLIK